MKIGIVTCHLVNSFGSVLQTYALCKVLQKNGVECRVINYLYPARYHLVRAKGYIPLRSRPFSLALRIVIKRCVSLLQRWCGIGQAASFARFRTHFLPLSGPLLRGEEAVKRHVEREGYQVLFTGSDQIWNPAYTHEDGVFFLAFTDEKMRRVAYSSSFGVRSIDAEHAKLYGMWLDRFDAISVRELSGIDLVRSISHKEARQLIDPTMLLTRPEWLSLVKRKKHLRPYVLSFCLRYIFDPYPYANEVLDFCAEQLGVCRESIWNQAHEHAAKIHRVCSVNEFIGLIDDAQFVVTTSFHGCVFSLLLHTPFIVIQRRESGDSRLRDLLRLLELEDRIVFLGDTIENRNIKEIDFSLVETRLAPLRKEALEFISTNLGEK